MPSINTELGERALSKMQHEFDWKPLKERCLRVYPTWSARHVDRVLREYQRFLALKVATRDIYDTIVLAPVLLDAMWRQHLLSTQQYYADCQLLLQANQILHYNADVAVNVRSSVREKRMELTKASLCMMFSGMNSLSSEAKGIWDYGETAQEEPIDSGESVTAGEQEETTDDFNTGTEDDDEEDETEMESEHRSQRKDRIRKTKSAKSKATDSPGKEDRRLVLYVYRNGKVIKVSAYSHDTISTLKARIQRKTGLAQKQQVLEWDGMVLDDKKTISYYEMPNDATLVLMKVKKLHKGTKDSLKRTESHNNEDQSEAEDRLSLEERDEPDRYKRRNGGSDRRTNSPTRRRPRTKDSQEVPLSPLSPKAPRPPRQESLAYSPSREDDSHLSATVSANPSSDHKRRQQHLNKMKIQSRDVIDDHEDSSLEPGSTLPSRPRPKPSQSISVFINTIMGFTITLTAKSSDTVDHLKQMIEEQEDIPSRKQILILEGVPLVDSQQLSDYTSSSSLHVLLRLQAGSSSVASVAASSLMTPTSNMATLTRKMNQNKIMSRTTVASER